MKQMCSTDQRNWNVKFKWGKKSCCYCWKTECVKSIPTAKCLCSIGHEYMCIVNQTDYHKKQQLMKILYCSFLGNIVLIYSKVTLLWNKSTAVKKIEFIATKISRFKSTNWLWFAWEFFVYFSLILTVSLIFAPPKTFKTDVFYSLLFYLVNINYDKNSNNW